MLFFLGVLVSLTILAVIFPRILKQQEESHDYYVDNIFDVDDEDDNYELFEDDDDDICLPKRHVIRDMVVNHYATVPAAVFEIAKDVAEGLDTVFDGDVTVTRYNNVIELRHEKQDAYVVINVFPKEPKCTSTET